jgi:3-hydroxybutyryl-CoA dehydrogenase
MIVNEAVELVARGEASAADVDTAMRLGTGYPAGPLEWGDAIGPEWVESLVDLLGRLMPSGRYRSARWLWEATLTGRRLRDL